MRIVKSMSFDAAHFLDHDPDARPYARLHGHSFTMEVVIDGEPQAETGWVVDFGEVAEALQSLHDALDHRLLNEVEGLERPTLENIASYIHAVLSQNITDLYAVEVARPSLKERVKFCPFPGR